MNIKKALTFIAFGFLFTLVNINLTLNGTTVNIMPDFVGWILIYLSLGCLGDYAKDKQYLKVFALLIAVVKAALWLADIIKPEIDLETVKAITGLADTVFMFIFFGIIEKIAEDHNSTRTDTIRTLKWFNVISYIVLAVTGLLYDKMKLEFAAMIVLIAGLVAFVCAVITMFVLFGLRKEINEKLA